MLISQVMIPQLNSFSNFGYLVYLVVAVTLVVAASEDDKLNSSRNRRQVYQPPHVDEKLVSAFINNPEAVKMVMSYLNKQKSTPPPLSFFFGGKKPLSQLIQEHRDTIQQIKATSPPAHVTPEVAAVGPALEPLAGRLPDNKAQKDMQFFGPKDFVPQKAYQPPLGPMRLRYATTQEFPTRTYGRLVPMPR